MLRQTKAGKRRIFLAPPNDDFFMAKIAEKCKKDFLMHNQEQQKNE